MFTRMFSDEVTCILFRTSPNFYLNVISCLVVQNKILYSIEMIEIFLCKVRFTISRSYFLFICVILLKHEG